MRAPRSLSVALALVLGLCLAVGTAAVGAQEPVTQDPDVQDVAGVDIQMLRSGSGATVVPVRVAVVSRRALEGTLQLRSPNTNVTWELPVALAANSEVQQLFVVPTNGRSSLSLSAALIVDGTEIADDESDAAVAAVNAVGVLGLAAPGNEVQLTPEIGVASLIEMNDLTTIHAFDTVVASPAGIGSLTEAERVRLLQWTAAGRQLVIADDAGSIDGQLPAEWRSSNGVLQAGTGLIRYVGVDWAAAVPAGISSATNPQMAAGWFQPSSTELLSDAGFRVPGLGAMALLLVVYLLLAGPVTFVVLSQMKRQTLAWVVVPGLAILFAVGVFGVGRFLSSGRGDAYATVVELSPAGATLTDSVLIADDGRQTLELPEGWVLQATGLNTGNGDVGAPVVVAPTRAQTDLRFDIDAGSGGTAVLRGSSDELVGSLTITDASLDGGTLVGSVLNSSGRRLDNVTVLVGERLTTVGAVEDGASGEFAIDLSVNRNGFAPELRTWDVDPRDGWQFGPGQRDDDAAVNDGPANGSVWLEWRAARLGTSVPEGLITAVGWSRDLEGSLVDGTGRTAVVTHGSLPPTDGPALPAQIRTFQVVVPGGDQFGNFDGFEGGNTGLVSQFVRPSNADTSELAIEVLGQITSAEVWTAEGVWRSAKVDDEIGNLLLSIPDEMWVDDVLTVRYGLSDFFGEPGQMTTRLMPATDRTIQTELLPAGETSRRNGAGFDGPGPFEQEAALGAETTVVFAEDGTFEAEGELFGSYDVWQVELTEGDEVRVRMNANSNFGGNSLDPFLIIRDPDGAQIAENDDFDGLNSGLDFTANVTGTFDIETRPLGGGQAGSYVVRLEATLAEGGPQ